MLLAPGCLTNEKLAAPIAPQGTHPEERFIIIDYVEGVVRIRFKKINRPFLLPQEIKKIEKELKNLSKEELEILKKLIDHIYGAPPSSRAWACRP